MNVIDNFNKEAIAFLIQECAADKLNKHDVSELRPGDMVGIFVRPSDDRMIYQPLAVDEDILELLRSRIKNEN